MPSISSNEFSTDVPWEAQVLADDLMNGKPEIGWKGDPRLRLQIEQLLAARNGLDDVTGAWKRRGERVAWRYKVVRDMEDGSVEAIGTWTNREFHQILPNLVTMDPRTPGHKTLVQLSAEAEARTESRKQREFAEAYGPMVEHALSLRHDLGVGKTTFRQIGGSDERPDRNLASDAD